MAKHWGVLLGPVDLQRFAALARDLQDHYTIHPLFANRTWSLALIRLQREDQ